MNKLILIFLILCLPLSVSAEDVSVSVSPRTAYVGAQVEVTYSIQTEASGEGKLLGRFPKGLTVLGGPVRGEDYKITSVNGHLNSRSSTTFTYYLQAERPGRYTLPAFSIAGRKSRNATLTVEDDGAARPSSTPNDDDLWKQMNQLQKQMQQQMQQIVPPVQPQASAPVTNSSVRPPHGARTFLHAKATKTTAYEQEAILLTYTLYSQDRPVNLLRKLNPKFDNFQYKALKVEGDRDLSRERLQGKVYYTTPMYKFVLFPQKSGRLIVPPLHIEVETLVGFSGQRVKASSDSLVFHIKSLPPRPDGFTGAVGHDFSLRATLDPRNVAAGDAARLVVRVSGVGNLTLMGAPEPVWPRNLQHYDPKTSDKTELTSGGSRGDVVFTYIVVPEEKGDYNIPPIPFVYFDTNTQSYRTVQSSALPLRAQASTGGKTSSLPDDIAADISPLRRGTSSRVALSSRLLGQPLYWAAWGMVLLCGGAYTLLRGRHAVRRPRRDKTRAMALGRLEEARQLMRDGRREAFHDEVLHALWMYLSDKLSLPLLDLNKDNIASLVQERGAEGDVTTRLLACITTCEAARYAPTGHQVALESVYEDAVESIVAIDRSLTLAEKKKRRPQPMALLWLVVLFSLQPLAMAAGTDATAAYLRGDYKGAAQEWNEELRQGADADIYYNLGASHYRQKQWAEAILCYERSLLLSPGRDDAETNLAMARANTRDAISEPEPFFLIGTWQRAAAALSVDAWALLALVAFAFVVALAAMLTVGPCPSRYRKGVLSAAYVFGLVSLVSLAAALTRHSLLTDTSAAILMAPRVSVSTTPSEGAHVSFTLHAGTKICVEDTTIAHWTQISTSDGRQGWVRRDVYQRIRP